MPVAHSSQTTGTAVVERRGRGIPLQDAAGVGAPCRHVVICAFVLAIYRGPYSAPEFPRA
jgi:hypothetical protein